MNEGYKSQVALLNILELCKKAQSEFNMSCRARVVPFSLLYGGKIAAALGRQHPRDLFDYKHMAIDSFDEIKNGVVFYLLGSDKPLIESLQPNPIDQQEALNNQFKGMTDIPFEYADFEAARNELKELVLNNLNVIDREFLLSYENGIPEWNKCCVGDLHDFPAIRWKLKNIQILKETNTKKFKVGINTLEKFLINNIKQFILSEITPPISASKCSFYLFFQLFVYICIQKSHKMHLDDLIKTIKERREMLNVTQATLAELSGVGLRTLKQFESGKGNPTLLTLQKLADVLGMEISMQVKKLNNQ